MHLLATFAAFSMAGTVLLSLLPEGGIKRTAAMAVGLLTLSCWAEGIASLFGVTLPDKSAVTPLAPTAMSIVSAEEAASGVLSAQWRDAP